MPYPSHDTINRVFPHMDPDKFETCFGNWIESILVSNAGELISIDGKPSGVPKTMV